MEPERKPSRSRVAYVNPIDLKMRTSSSAISSDIARGSSSRAISIRAICPMMAQPELLESQVTQRIFGTLDLPENLQRYFPSVFNARRQTCGSRLIPHSKARRTREITDVLFRQVCLPQGSLHSMRAGCLTAGTIVALSVSVDAVNNRLEMVLFPKAVERGEQLIFAMKASHTIVSHILGPLHLAG
jgi:hypothetical protein